MLRQKFVPLATRLFSSSPSHAMALIKELREKSQAPMSDVKTALVQTNWDLEAAHEVLRKKGLAAAMKKATRTAADGLLGVASNASSAVIVEVNSETDFVARTDTFQQLVQQIAQASLAVGTPSPSSSSSSSVITELDPAAVQAARMPDGTTVQDAVTRLAASVRENIRFRRAFRASTSSNNEHLVSYLHASPAPHVGRIASLLIFKSEQPALNDAAKAARQDLTQKLAMQIVAMRPRYLDRTTVPPLVLDKEKEILLAQLASSGKPKNIIEKMVQGKLSKFYQEACLAEQPYMLDDKSTVTQVLDRLGKEHALGKTRIVDMMRIEVGEGIAVAENDFATEVEKMAKGGK